VELMLAGKDVLGRKFPADSDEEPLGEGAPPNWAHSTAWSTWRSIDWGAGRARVRLGGEGK